MEEKKKFIKSDYREVNKNKRFCNVDIVEETAQELGVSESLVKDIVGFHSKMSRTVIETGAFESVTLPYLGKLKAKLKSKQKADSKVNRP